MFDLKAVLGLLMILSGIAAFIEAIQATPVEALDAAISFARVWFSALVGWCAFLVLVIPGLKFLK